MRVEKRKVSELKEYPGNPRWMSKESIEKLKKSIQEFGLVVPLVINPRNEVIGGNQRLKALQELGIEEVDCIVVDLPKKKEKKLNLALNRISGAWDYEKLLEFLRSPIEDLEIEELKLEDLGELGFSDSEIQFLKDLELAELKEKAETIPEERKKRKIRIYPEDEEQAQKVRRFLNEKRIEWEELLL